MKVSKNFCRNRINCKWFPALPNNNNWDLICIGMPFKQDVTHSPGPIDERAEHQECTRINRSTFHQQRRGVPWIRVPRVAHNWIIRINSILYLRSTTYLRPFAAQSSSSPTIYQCRVLFVQDSVVRRKRKYNTPPFTLSFRRIVNDIILVNGSN